MKTLLIFTILSIAVELTSCSVKQDKLITSTSLFTTDYSIAEYLVGQEVGEVGGVDEHGNYYVTIQDETGAAKRRSCSRQELIDTIRTSKMTPDDKCTTLKALDLDLCNFRAI